MNQRRFVAVMFTLIAILSLVTSASAEPAAPKEGKSQAAFVPWHASTVKVGVDVSNTLSIGLGGSHNYPLISYENFSDDQTRLIFYRPAVGEPGNMCGPDWICTPIIGDAARYSYSRIVTYNYINSFKVGWAYEELPSTDLNLRTMEFTDDVVWTGSDIETTIVDFSAFPGPNPNQTGFLVGAPSLEFDEFGNAHIAFVMQYGAVRKVMYAHKMPSAATIPCNLETNTRWQCDTIIEAADPAHIGEAHFVIDQENEPHILYTTFNGDIATGKLMLARQETSLLKHPNCGPGGNTWRCFQLDQAGPGNTIFHISRPQMIQMAVGPASPHVAYMVDDGLNNLDIRHAKFVGTGGNCGEDYALVGINPIKYELRNRWQCENITWIEGTTSPPYTSFSLQVDALDYPVIAAGYRLTSNSYYHATLIYPSERRGLSSGWWYQDLDGQILTLDEGRHLRWEAMIWVLWCISKTANTSPHCGWLFRIVIIPTSRQS